MQITVKGGSRTTKKHIVSMVEYCAKKLMPRMKNLEIVVRLKDISKTDCYGFCTADPESDAERGDRPRTFEIEVHKHLKLRRLLETIAHEMVHVKQYAQGELYQGTRVNKHRWQGIWLDKDPDYWDQPWEIEAMGRETGLFVRWAQSAGVAKKKWVKVDK